MRKKIIIILFVYVFYCIGSYLRTKQQGLIIIYSENLLDLVSYSAGMGKGVAKGVSLPPPFIGLRWKDHEMNDIRIHHEQIHQLQRTETLGLLPLYSQGEKLFARRILDKDAMQSYLRKTTEQEAYLNQSNPNYILNRPLRASMFYLTKKVDFELKDYKVVLK